MFVCKASDSCTQLGHNEEMIKAHSVDVMAGIIRLTAFIGVN